MFNQAQKDYIEYLVPILRDQGYPYYIAHTNSSLNDPYYRRLPDLKLVFSRDEITSSDGYSFKLTSNSVQYDVFTYNASEQYQEPRMSKKSISGTYTVPQYEHISTNCDYTTSSILQPDIMAEGSALTNYAQGTLLTAAVILFCLAFFAIFKLRR